MVIKRKLQKIVYGKIQNNNYKCHIMIDINRGTIMPNKNRDSLLNPHILSVRPAQETVRHHLMRYIFAMNFLGDDDNVIDIGCGSGYGTNILGIRGNQVLGIDSSPEAVEYAKLHYPYDSFQVMDALHLKGKWDFGVCFEFIEHLEREKGLVFLKNINKHVSRLVLSSPVNAKIGINPYHLSEWSLEDFRSILEKGFDTVRFLSQDWQTGRIGDFGRYHSFIIVVCGATNFELLE